MIGGRDTLQNLTFRATRRVSDWGCDSRVRLENWRITHHGITLPHDDMFRRLDSIDMARQEFVDLKAQYQSGVQVFRCSEAQSTHLVRAVAADDDHLPGCGRD